MGFDDDGYPTLMGQTGGTIDEVRVPEGTLGESLKAAFNDGKELDVTVLTAMGEDAATAFREQER
ncbi:hypothetical protein [Streptomyces sp. NPDC051704]|uniref:hypothetical protein n=1 Tax=Streptomyces sp. NPDC051704 TaxID=3365671 RepID=UPI0037991AD0